MGWIKMSYDWDWAGADAEFQKALELEPGNARIIRNKGRLASTLGRLDEAVALCRRSLELDPMNVIAHLNLGNYLLNAGRLEESAAHFVKASEIQPDREAAHAHLAIAYLLQGKTDPALQEITRENDEMFRLYGLALVYNATGNSAASDEALQDCIIRYGDVAAYQVASVYAYRGEVDKSFEWLERAYAKRDPGLSEMKGDPLLINLQRDPRYAEFLKKMKLPS